MARYRCRARSSLMRVIDPFTRALAGRKPSSWWVMTSTRALPMPTTSRSRRGTAAHASAGVRHRSRRYARPMTSLAPIEPVDDPYRLPPGAVPSRYDVVLEPDLDAGTFRGEVDIAVGVTEPVAELVLNAVDLEIDAAAVDGPSGEHTAVARLDPERERLHLSTGATLAPGAYTVRISFRGVLNDKLVGFYRSTFTDDDGRTHVIATTQMEATDCRRAFPCWDEPERKAVFGVTLVVAENLLAISNGPEVERTPVEGGRVRIRFADTIRMSTYVVAFVVGPLVATDPVDVDGTPLRVVHVAGKEHLAGFA